MDTFWSQMLCVYLFFISSFSEKEFHWDISQN